MAQREVQGKDILLFIDPLGGTSYDLIVCLTSQTITLATNKIDSSSKCGTSSSPSTSTADVAFDGNVQFGPTSPTLSADALFTLWLNQTIFSWKMGPATPVTGDVVYNALGFLSALTLTYPEGVATFAGTISVTNVVTQVITA